MRLQRSRPLQLLLSLAALTHVSAFSDTSPYFVVSESDIPDSARAHNILSASTFIDAASAVIKRCDAEAYIIVSQPGLHIEDLNVRANAAVHLKDLLASTADEHKWEANNVFSSSQAEDMGGVVETLQAVATGACNAQVEGVDARIGTFKPFDNMKPKVVRIDFERLPVEKAAREKTLEQHDAFLHTVLEMLHPRKLALIYASSPISSLSDEEKVAVAKAQKAAKQEEAKVALELRSVKYRSDEDLQDPAKENGTVVVGGLFHRYQFFTPAIFMGYMALFLMLAILYVGLSAVSSIEVSYGAFEKDMGPAAAKKQQ